VNRKITVIKEKIIYLWVSFIKEKNLTFFLNWGQSLELMILLPLPPSAGIISMHQHSWHQPILNEEKEKV
jgi:hypothetical protein